MLLPLVFRECIVNIVGTPILLRHLTFSEAKKMPIKEVYLDKVLEHLKLTMDQVIYILRKIIAYKVSSLIFAFCLVAITVIKSKELEVLELLNLSQNMEA